MLEIKHLETLTAIREAGSLQEAAEQLYVTQSALSHQLRELEARLGVSLLNRRTRPARLTTAALRILALADEVLPRIQATEKELQSLAKGVSGRLYLAIDCHSRSEERRVGKECRYRWSADEDKLDVRRHELSA